MGSKDTVTSSVIERNLAEAALHRAKARGEDRNEAYLQHQDFRSGHFTYSGVVHTEAVDGFLAALRSFSREFPKKPILLELKSPGGSIIDGFHFYDELMRLKSLGHKLTIRVHGMAASMGSVVLQAADVREAGSNSWIMIHRGFMGAIGKTFEVEDSVEFMNKLENQIVDLFTARSKKPRKSFVDLFKKRKDIWFSAKEALQFGLIDGVI